MTYINGRDPIVIIDGIDRSSEVTSWEFTPGTRTTLDDMRGRTPRQLNMTITQDDGANTLYSMAFAATGTVTGIVKPHGNASATAALPHYTFTLTPFGISSDQVLGGAADNDPSKPLTADVQWLISGYTKVTA